MTYIEAVTIWFIPKKFLYCSPGDHLLQPTHTVFSPLLPSELLFFKRNFDIGSIVSYMLCLALGIQREKK